MVDGRRYDARAQKLDAFRPLVFPSLMVIDESGYLPIGRTVAMLFFPLMSHRYEHAASVLTSNKLLEDWGELLGDEAMAAALIDRIVQHCHIVNIRGNSYWLREHSALAAGLAPPTPIPDRPRRVRREGP